VKVVVVSVGRIVEKGLGVIVLVRVTVGDKVIVEVFVPVCVKVTVGVGVGEFVNV